MSGRGNRPDVVRLKPYRYIHVHDNNSNTTDVIVGPATFTRMDHQQVLLQPTMCISIPPNSYCVIENPVQRDSKGEVIRDKNNQAKTRIGDTEIRFAQEPFPLYPGEVLKGEVQKLEVLGPRNGFRVRAVRNFTDGKVARKAGDEWLMTGPCTYVPRVEVEKVQSVDAIVLKFNQAIKLRARITFTDSRGKAHKAGEEYLHSDPGAFFPAVEEEVVTVMDAYILTDKKAIHVEAITTFKDAKGVERRAGTRWLVDITQTPSYIPTPSEKVIAEVNLTKVGSRQYAVIQDYVDTTGKQRLGQKVLREGPSTFFLHPGESLEDGRVKDIFVLSSDEALLLSANEKFTDKEAGDRWMVRGPQEFIPPVQVNVVEKRKAIPLDLNEGVYVRNVFTGAVRAHVGSTIMLNESEELWDKELPPLVEELLAAPKLTKLRSNATNYTKKRVKHFVVTCNVPHNSLVQIYDYRLKKARVVRGPELVSLGPDEEFTVLSLSGDKPKKSDIIRTLALALGPDFMTDIITVETADHARLNLQLSYNWYFEQDGIEAKAFAVPDFVGDACKAMASRIRGYVAGETFDNFHRHSSQIIKTAVFGLDKDRNLKPAAAFKNNNLVIDNVDIHSVDPVDPKTREALTKSVQLAIEITTKSQEAQAHNRARTLEQEARGRLERQNIEDGAQAETFRKDLLALEADNAAIESTGASKAESKARAEARGIEGQAQVELTELRSKTKRITADVELAMEREKQKAELDYQEQLYEEEVNKTRALAQIEADKFKKTINAVGQDTIRALAMAGPELQARLLKSLGLQGYLVTDGTNPINLFNTAKGMTAPIEGGSVQPSA